MKPRRMDGSPQKIMYVAKFESLSIYQAMKRCLVMGVAVELLPELAGPSNEGVAFIHDYALNG